jgi:hypothetical protein
MVTEDDCFSFSDNHGVVIPTVACRVLNHLASGAHNIPGAPDRIWGCWAIVCIVLIDVQLTLAVVVPPATFAIAFAGHVRFGIGKSYVCVWLCEPLNEHAHIVLNIDLRSGVKQHHMFWNTGYS